MAKHVLPMLLDKLSSEVSTAKEAALKTLVAGVRAFGALGAGGNLRPIGQAMYEEVRKRVCCVDQRRYLVVVISTKSESTEFL